MPEPGEERRSKPLSAPSATQIKAEIRHGIVAADALAAQALAPGPDHDLRWLTETKMRKPRRVSRGTPDDGRSTGRRRDNDVSNSSRLLATVEGESAYAGRVRGANGNRWKVI